jgi:hypothetical protein
MALTLEALFAAYENTGEYDLGEGKGLDFAEDLYNFFGLEEGGIGAKEFADKYSMYIPTYDPTEEHLAYQDKYLAFRNAGETHNLSKALTEELYSTEMENVSGALGKEVSKGKQMAGGLGLRSGTLESAMEETMDLFGGKAKDIGKQYDLKKTGDLNAYNTKLVDATLDYDKSEHRIKQDFYDEVMASMMRLSERGAFDEKCTGDTPVMCDDGTCANRAEWCPGFVDVCGTPNGSAKDISECEGYTSPDEQSSVCESVCHASQGIGADGQTCIETCLGGTFTVREDGSVIADFNPRDWREENYDYIKWNDRCTDEDGNWICLEDNPDTEKDESLECLNCSMSPVNLTPDRPTSHWVEQCGHWSDSQFSPCDPACCPG